MLCNVRNTTILIIVSIYTRLDNIHKPAVPFQNVYGCNQQTMVIKPVLMVSKTFLQH